MSTATTSSSTGTAAAPRPRVGLKMPVVYATAALLTVLLFLRGTPADVSTIFQFGTTAEWFTIPNVSVPALLTISLLTVVMAAAAVWAYLLVRQRRRPPVWLHGDLLPGNLLTAGGRLAAVIDFGCMGAGDPACDLFPAWHLLPPGARDLFREALGVDDATWRRGRGRALSQALIALPYYRTRNPAMARAARHVIRTVLADAG